MKKTKKIFWSMVGFISLAIGMVGAVMPFLPTFPFLMLTLYSFSRSSERLRKWFIGTKLYKDNLETYVVSRAMTKKTKVRIMITVTLLMSFGFVMMGNVLIGRMVLCGVWIFHVIYFIFGVKTLPKTTEA